MFLNQTSQYALRAMTGLVRADNTKPISSNELAQYSGVPSHYLSKIMRKMVEAGYVKSQKGHGGGFLLSVEPSKINIMDVLTAAGFEAGSQPCVFGYEKCEDKNPCPLHPIWKRLKDSFNEWAFNTTFEEIGKEAALISRDDFNQNN
ncbi:MAG: Rrf2 family transcriptional regulator [Gracilimonas sp.]|uniref:RrF2 family transcriptional regulator n=1 Tax=Gracilimonas sp. TaxID=1974203 RepID=UPI003750A5C9|nr:Rrf2 family transcriptional regulator [Gracilimonas sp.]